jgi:hypothetical protein
MKIGDAVTYLSKDAKDFWTEHLGRHDDGEEVIRGIFHDLVVMTVIADDVDGFDDVDMLQASPDAEFCSYLFLVFAF